MPRKRKLGSEAQPAPPQALQAELEARAARHIKIEAMLIQYPRWNVIIEKIAFIHRHAAYAAEPRGILLLAHTGAGKTTLLATYAALHQPMDKGEVVERPVVFAQVPARATPDLLASALLRGMGDPRWDRGNLGNKTFRLIDYLRKGKTRLLVLDEIQHFEDTGRIVVLEEAARWLKNLIKDEDIKIACVFIGLYGHTDQLMQANEGQLARFFGDPFILDTLAYDESQGLKTNEFRGFLDELDLVLPFPQRSNLKDEDTAWRCFVASLGLVNYVMKMIRYAAHIAVEQGRPCLDRDLLAEAFDAELAGERRGIPNPFDGERPDVPKPQGNLVPRIVLPGRPPSYRSSQVDEQPEPVTRRVRGQQKRRSRQRKHKAQSTSQNVQQVRQVLKL